MARAANHLRAGETGVAAKLYAGLLERQPRDAQAAHMLGLTELAQGDHHRAVELIGRALAIAETADAHGNLGTALAHCGRAEEAIKSFTRALALAPDSAQVLGNLGLTLSGLRRHAEAAEAFARACALAPGEAGLWGSSALALYHCGRLGEAATHAEHSLALRPEAPDVLNTYGITLQKLRRSADAVEALLRAVRLRPAFTEAWSNLGASLNGAGRSEEAVAACRRALALRPHYVSAEINLGNALHDLDRPAEAEAALRRAIALQPTEVEAYNKLAITLIEQQRWHEALAVLDLAEALDPREAETQHHRAMLLLALGRFDAGWALYDWRFKTRMAGGAQKIFVDRPPWRGETLANRSILLLAEQGLGDALQFMRYVPKVAEQAARVTLALPPSLLRLARSLGGGARLAPLGETLPPHDVHCPLLSLPLAFGTTAETIPGDAPYLAAEPDLAMAWQARLARLGSGRRIGLVWAGNPTHLNDRRRSLPIDLLAPLWALPGLVWCSLQVGARAADLASTPDGLIADLAPDLTDFAATAAAVAGLDLVIAADTSVAHLAGALGRPVWLLLPASADWRWQRFGDTTPWYPTMRLFRQDASRAWPPVVAAVAQALRQQFAAD